MTAWAFLNLLAGALEVCVPSYAFRLVRRFGAHQVGRFVVIAFICLALLHLVEPIKPVAGLALTVVYAAASVLLLVGMGHVETVCEQQQRLQIEEKQLRERLEAEAR